MPLSPQWTGSAASNHDAKPITIPYAISVFPDELYQAPRSWAERAYPRNLIHYNQLDRGGHFAHSCIIPRGVRDGSHVDGGQSAGGSP